MSTSKDLYKDLPPLDPSQGAAASLNAAITKGDGNEDIVILDEKLKTREEEKVTEEAAVREEQTFVPETVSAAAARRSAPILETESSRTMVRLLILTRNVSIRELGSLAQRHMLELGQVFSEIHIIILNERDEDTVATVRLSDNIWLYSTESTTWWRTPLDAYRIAEEQISFAGGFRADVIVAEDPFECGLAGYFIAKKHARPFQVHVLEDIYEPAFEDRDEHNALRLFAARFVLPRAGCVRTLGEFVRASIVDEYPKLAAHTEMLPTYYNLRAWRDTVPTFDLKDRYPQFKFIVLHISTMQVHSHTSEVITAMAGILHRYPTIGLVIVGNGPLRSAIEKQVITLGIHNQVEFEPMPAEVISHMKTASMLLHLSEDPEEDQYVLQAATVKLPMVASIGSVANTLFVDGDSALLCQSADTFGAGKRVNTFLNENQLRTRLALNAQEVVFERIEQDYARYLEAYRNSIERCVG